MSRKSSKSKAAKEPAGMSRRSTLALMGKSAGIIAAMSYLGLAMAWPLLARADEMSTPDGGFELTTTSTGGVTTHALAKPGRLVFTMDNITREKTVPILAVPKDTGNLTDEEQKQREAVQQLLAASGSFAAPRDITLSAKRTEGKIRVSFLFMGEEDSARRIRLTVNAKNASGSSLGTWSRDCSDQRIVARESNIQIGGNFKVSLQNSETFTTDSATLSNISGVVVTLEEL